MSEVRRNNQDGVTFELDRVDTQSLLLLGRYRRLIAVCAIWGAIDLVVFGGETLLWVAHLILKALT